MTTLKRLIQTSTILIVGAIGTFSLTGFLGEHAWIFELTSHFRVQYFAILGFCLPFALRAQMKRLAATAVVFMAINLLSFSPFRLSIHSAHAAPTIKAAISILQVNVYGPNQNHSKVSDLIESTKADMVAVLELNQRWDRELEAALATYAYRSKEVRDDCIGIGLFSRVPFETTRIERFGPLQVPTIVVDVRVGGEPVSIVVTHPLAPTTPALLSDRNRHFDGLARLRETLNPNVILVGDLNATPWSPYFRRLVSAMDLQDSRHGFGLQPTWPTIFPLMLIPLDHCLISKGIHTLERRVGPHVGSDHYPVFVELGVS